MVQFKAVHISSSPNTIPSYTYSNRIKVIRKRKIIIYWLSPAAAI